MPCMEKRTWKTTEEQMMGAPTFYPSMLNYTTVIDGKTYEIVSINYMNGTFELEEVK